MIPIFMHHYQASSCRKPDRQGTLLPGALQRAGAKSRPDVAAVRLIKVTIGVVNQTRSGRPATAPKNLVIAKPGRRVFFVWSRHESRIGAKVTRGPFPNVPDHLTAAERAVACRQQSNVDATHSSPVEI